MRITATPWLTLLLLAFPWSAQAQVSEAPGADGLPAPSGDSAARWEARNPSSPPDLRSGHIQLSGSVAFVLPFGAVAEDTSQSARFGPGLGYQLDVGYGVSRSVVVGGWGQILMLSDGSACGDCAGTGYAGGLFARYHLVQGLRFDPWFSFGVGYRTQSHDVSGVERTYSGLEWGRLQFGGDWYAIPQIGFGPYVELAAGTFFNRPDDEPGASVYWRFQAGLRVTFDIGR